MKVFMKVFILFLMSGFCLEGNVVKRGAVVDTPERAARRMEIAKLNTNEQTDLLQQRLHQLQAVPIVKAARPLNPARQKHSKLNDWGVRFPPIS